MKLFKKIKRKKDNSTTKNRTIILDTSALNSYKAMEIIEEEGTEVIMLTGTILEMDNWKHKKGVFGNNVRKISKKSREDKESKKFICVADYDEYSYQDRNIIEYCRKNKEVIILTSDNNLCNIAKAYNIKYIFIEQDFEIDKESDLEDAADVVDIVEEEEKFPKETKRQYIYFHENGIRFAPRRGFYTYLRLETDNGVVYDKLYNYKEGDFIYEILCSKKCKCIEIFKYEITKKDGKYSLKEDKKEEIRYMNEIFRLNFSDKIQNEILEIFKENCGY